MKFCDFAKLMHDNYEEKANAGKFVVILFDAILDGEALEKAEPNPLYGLGKSLLQWQTSYLAAKSRADCSTTFRGDIRGLRRNILS